MHLFIKQMNKSDTYGVSDQVHRPDCPLAWPDSED